MTKYLSDKLRVLSFIAMVMVVVLHSYKVTITYDSGNLDLRAGYNFFIRLFFSEGLARVAVPFFFFVSGYLFFIEFKGAKEEFIVRYRKRARSLLLPYLLWSGWGLCFYFMLQLLPPARHFFTNDLVENYSATQFLDTLFLNPIPYQLWFLRDLIVLVILSPFIYWIIRYSRIVLPLLLFITWFVFFDFSFVIFRTESLLFFSLGAYVSIYKSHLLLKKYEQPFYFLFAAFWIGAVLLKTNLLYQNTGQVALVLLLNKLGILTGIIAIWSLYDMALNNRANVHHTLTSFSTFSFFIYGFHEPVLTMVQKGLFYLTGASEPMILLNYILSPALTVGLGILFGSLLKRCMPQFYGVITGGR